MAMLPILSSVLAKADFKPIAEEERQIDHFVTGRNAHLIKGSNFNESGQNNEYVAVIALKDPIYKYDQECGPYGTKSKIRRLQSFEADPNCKGIVLDIDSGGGQVSGTPEFHDIVKNFSKPIVTYTDGLMCSAAYYIGSASSHIVANKRADAIGSIGVMIHFVDLTGYFEQLGAKVITEYSTHSTEKNRPLEELLGGDASRYIKEELDPIAETFIADMKAARSGIPEDTFLGGTWNAQDALSRNLIDEIGTLQTAVEKVFELAKNTNPNSNTMSKNRTNLQAVLGLDAPLVETEEKGSYLNGEQLDTVETRLAENESSIATLTQERDEALANVNQDAADATAQVTTAEASVDALLTDSGLEITGTLQEKLTSLSAHVVELNAKDGADHTNPKTDGNLSTSSNVIGGIDVSAALNN
ncbi:S49 family peptidase [Flavobacterium sp.]|uniref:S49 family peptidase n=1 Tax=Flavobacterium sp. TaxID=239 RepID=UPI0011F692DA|nr:S49 family peptidase [Flavobacterium sp.]RZJ71093.1 MAG: hypothetical protein EOO49_11610 [Flavobacterium sp.]